MSVQQSIPEVVYVDLDGTLSPSDLLVESCLQLMRRNVLYLFLLVFWALKGGWRLKTEVAKRLDLDTHGFPVRAGLIEQLQAYKAQGVELVLASASLATQVRKVAAQVGIFDRVIASENENLKGARKLQAIELDAQGRSWAYVGDARVDLSIWRATPFAWAVAPSSSTQRKAHALGIQLKILLQGNTSLRALRKAMRMQQWAKNALLFLPLLAAHEPLGLLWLDAVWAFLSLGLVASATYLWNDLMDLPADRRHPRKRLRPMAAGTVPPQQALGVMLVLYAMGMGVSLLVLGWPYTLALAVYTASTLLYTFVLKEVAFLDVLTLGLLYTFRVVAGGVATDIEVSSWLLAISLFVFLSLALVKRCAELELLKSENKQLAQGRGYQTSDLPYLVAMGVSSGFMAVLVLALYADSQNGNLLYSNPKLLWCICPVLLYWLMRVWILTSRRQMVDDPVHFALNDRLSWLCLALIGLVAWAAR